MVLANEFSALRIKPKKKATSKQNERKKQKLTKERKTLKYCP